MKKWIQVIGFLVALATASPARAGQWEVVDYKRDAHLHDENVVAYDGADYNQPFFLKSKLQKNGCVVQNKPPELDGGGSITDSANRDNVSVSWNETPNGPAPSTDPPATPGAKKGHASASITMRAVFRWKPSSLPESSIPDPDDKPTPLYIVESASITGRKGIWGYNNAPVTRYSADSTYGGSHFTFTEVKCPFQNDPGGKPFGFRSFNGSGNERRYEGSGHKVTLIDAKGQTEVMGPSRTLSGNIDMSTAYGNPDDLSCQGGAGLSFGYGVSVCRFSLDVGVPNEFNRLLNEPRDKALEAYATKAYTGATDPELPIRFYWDGLASYRATISDDLMERIGTPTYSWKLGEQRGFFEGTSGVIDPLLLDPTITIGSDAHNEGVVETSTATKILHHQIADQWWLKLAGGQAKKTNLRLIVSGSNPGTGNLTAKAKIDWYPDPNTRYRSESKFEMIDLDTGEVTPFNPAALGGAGDEEAQLDAYIAEITAKKEETFETGKSLISTAFEAEMMVGSWFVPDESDFLLPVAGHAVGFLYKSAKKAKVLAKVLEKATGVGERALSVIKKERRLEQKSDNIIIRITNDVEKEGRLGHVSPGSQLGEDAAEDAVKAKKGIIIGQCFVAGTPVVMADGSLKAIEQVKVGDEVMSRDEDTGVTQSKRVVQTFQHQADATLLLTFSNGEHIETTNGHPFYVQGRGFVKAGELGIGTSIVTRAGPSLKLQKSETKAQPAKVYNFEVDGFHTYFVGQSGVWVHNLCVTITNAQLGQKFGEHRLEYPGWTFQDYKNKINEMVNDGSLARFIVPVTEPTHRGEMHIVSGNDLLRLKRDSEAEDLWEFVSLYPGASSRWPNGFPSSP